MYSHKQYTFSPFDLVLSGAWQALQLNKDQVRVSDSHVIHRDLTQRAADNYDGSNGGQGDIHRQLIAYRWEIIALYKTGLIIISTFNF